MAGELQRKLEEAEALLTADGWTADARSYEVTAEIKYATQNAPLSLPLAEGALDEAMLDDLAEAFARAHEAVFGYRSDGEEVQFVALKVVGRGVMERSRLPARIDLAPNAARSPDRRVYFGPDHGWVETAIVDRGALDRTSRRGPLIVEEYDGTTVVPPDWTASLDDWNNIELIRHA